jgi:hypothetical protein
VCGLLGSICFDAREGCQLCLPALSCLPAWQRLPGSPARLLTFQLTKRPPTHLPAENAKIPCVGGHPKNIIMLCCDAFGVLPPVAKLTKEQVRVWVGGRVGGGAGWGRVGGWVAALGGLAAWGGHRGRQPE